jgi:hypothetical protein
VLGTDGTMLESSSYFFGFLLFVMDVGRQGATAVQHKRSIVCSSNTEVMFVLSTTPLKYAFPNQPLLLSKTTDSHISSPHTQESSDIRQLGTFFLFTCGGQLSVLWENRKMSNSCSRVPLFPHENYTDI